MHTVQTKGLKDYMHINTYWLWSLYNGKGGGSNARLGGGGRKLRACTLLTCYRIEAIVNF